MMPCDDFISSHFPINVSLKPNEFAEVPFGGALVVSDRDVHRRFLTVATIQNADTIFGIVTAVGEAYVTVASLHADMPPSKVEFDFLVIATGFSLPTLVVSPGTNLAQRRAELAQLNSAFCSGGNVVIGGGGLIALEVHKSMTIMHVYCVSPFV
jgi:pyruvate/2-oxoglutarate dehydrogenase complex dihydrolipoamide dehydrogenase (E3) component